MEKLQNLLSQIKKKKSNDIQVDILNLEDNGLPVNRLLNDFRNDLNVKLESLHLQLVSVKEMKKWVLSDWANAWKTVIPTKIQDANGLEVVLSKKQIEDVKAQLAIQNFKEITKNQNFNNIISDNSLAGIKVNIQNTEEFIFSFTLSDLALTLGDLIGLNINNYTDLTELAYAQLDHNWSMEEYSSSYQNNLSVLERLASGSLSDFDAGALAEAAGNSLQEVAEAIAAASAADVSMDLDATFQGMGYNDFAAAVAAYNAEYGTNYSVDQARDALGQ